MPAKTLLWQSIVIVAIMRACDAASAMAGPAGAIHVPPPYQPQIASALYRMERCSPWTYRAVTQVASTIEFEEHWDGGRTVPWKPNTITLGVDLLTKVRPDEPSELWLMFVLAHEARHLQQYRNPAWWLDLRLGESEYHRRREVDADLFAYAIIRDCGVP